MADQTAKKAEQTIVEVDEHIIIESATPAPKTQTVSFQLSEDDKKELAPLKRPSTASKYTAGLAKSAFSGAAGMGRRLEEALDETRMMMALKRGKIPQAVKEAMLLVTEKEELDQTAYYNDYIQSIVDKLFENSGQKKHPFRLVLSASNRIGASIITQAKPPIVTIHKGLIAQLEHEDELAGILAHEFSHQAIYDRIGSHKNSNPEEGGSDVWAVKMLQDAGYNPHGMLRAMKKIKRNESIGDGHFNPMRLLAPHPPTDIRIRNIENAIAVIESKQPLNKGFTPIDETAREQTKNIKVDSYVDGRLRAAGYWETPQSAEKQAEILSKLYIEATENYRNFAPFGERCKDLKKHMKLLIKKLKSEQKTQLLDPLFTHFLQIKTADIRTDKMNQLLTTLYGTLGEADLAPINMTNDESKYTVSEVNLRGVARPIAQSMKSFEYAKTIDEAAEAARYIADLIKNYDISESFIFSNVIAYSSSFFKVKTGTDDLKKEIESNGYYEFPWLRHHKWSQSDHKDADNIKTVLQAFGIIDGNVERNQSLEFFSRPVFQYTHTHYDTSMLSFDADGRIINVKQDFDPRFDNLTNITTLRESETKHFAITETRDKAALEDVKWEELEKDFWGFVAKYKTNLSPHLSVLTEGGDSFIGAFVAQLNAIRENKADNESLNRDITNFLNGKGPEGITRRAKEIAKGQFKKSNHLEEPHPLSLPAMLDNVQSKVRHFNDEITFKARLKNKNARPQDPKTRVIDRAYPKGLHISHPYFDLMKSLPQNSLNIVEAFSIVDKGQFRRANIDTKLEDIFDPAIRDTLGYTKPESFEELQKLMERFGEALGKNEGRRRNRQKEALCSIFGWELQILLRDNPDQCLDMRALYNTGYKYFFNSILEPVMSLNMAHSYTSSTLNPEEDRNLKEEDQSPKTEEAIKKEAFLEEYKELIQNAQYHSAKHQLAKDDISLKELIEQYQYFNTSHSVSAYGSFISHPAVFTLHPDMRKAFEKRIKEQFARVKKKTKRIKACEELLFETTLKDPDFRKWAVSEWVESQSKLMNSSFMGRSTIFLRLIAKDAIERAKQGQSVDMLSQLIDRLETQEKQTFMVRDLLIDGLLGKGEKEEGLISSVNDNLMVHLSDDPELRQAMLEFFCAPLSDETALQAYEKTAEMAAKKRHKDYSVSDLVKTLGLDYKLSDPAKIDIMGMIHRNYWSLPFAARTIYIERVLFPVDDPEEEKTFKEASDFVINQVIPLDNAYAKESRELLAAYMEECSKPLQRLILSALITANEQKTDPQEQDQQASADQDQGQDLAAALKAASADDNAIPPGKVLSLVLGKMGAAGGKTLQAIHSYMQSIETDDPDIIAFRDDLKASKSDFDRPFRWSIFDNMKRVLPKRKYNKLIVGKLLGSGSYGYTVAVRRKKNDWTALTLLRPDAEYEAQHQFSIFEKVAGKMAKSDDRWLPMQGILRNARDMAAIETDFDIAAQQIREAGNLYNGYKIEADGKVFTIKTARLSDHGPKFKETKIAVGEHFNDLPTSNEKERVYKRAAAKAIFTAEISIMLSGQGFDYDRHGAQQRIKGGKITMFDHGSLMMDADGQYIAKPTEQERKALGKVIAEVYDAIQKAEQPAAGDSASTQSQQSGIIQKLLESLQNAEKDPDVENYMQCFKRGILALSDYRQAMGDNDEQRNYAVKEAIMAVILSGSVDPVIMNAVIENTNAAPEHKAAAENKDALIAAFKEQNKANPIKIKRHGKAAFNNRFTIMKTLIWQGLKTRYDHAKEYVTGKNPQNPNPS